MVVGDFLAKAISSVDMRAMASQPKARAAALPLLLLLLSLLSLLSLPLHCGSLPQHWP